MRARTGVRRAHTAAIVVLTATLAAGCSSSGGGRSADGHPAGSVGPSYRGGIPNDDYTQGEETPPPAAAPLKVGQAATLGPLKVTLDRLDLAPGSASTLHSKHPKSWRIVHVTFTATNPTSAPADPGDAGMAVTAGPDGIEGTHYSYEGPGAVSGVWALGDTPIRAGGKRLVRWTLAVPTATDIQVTMTGDDGTEASWLGNAR